MKRFAYLFGLSLLFLFAITSVAWAGPAEEIAEIGRQRTQAFIQGDLDTWMAAGSASAPQHSVAG